MTRSEAAKICQSIKFILENSDYTEAVEEALNMAIEALEQEPSCRNARQVDLISRKQAIKEISDEFENEWEEADVNFNHGLNMALSIIKALSSADRPTGHWIENDNGTFSCSNCQSWIPKEQHHYARHCLYCGARMESDTE